MKWRMTGASYSSAHDLKEIDDVDDYQVERLAILRELGSVGIYVGRQTLETDLCRLFPGEVSAAFSELKTATATRQDVRNGVKNEQADEVDSEPRRKMLARIEAIGKGRFGQRLAAHIAEIDLRALVLDALDLEEDDVAGEAELEDIGGSSYLLQALDRVSMLVRKMPLLTDAGNQDGGSEEAGRGAAG